MSGMDRLTDELLEAYVSGKWKSYERDNIEMARELLAHRRASQAAPAPIYHGDLSILPDTEDKFRDMVCATAPSDALREAAATILAVLEDPDSLPYEHHPDWQAIWLDI